MPTVAVGLFLSAFLAGCGFFVNPTFSSTYISPASATIATSDTVQLAAHALYANGSQDEIGGDSVSWSSSDPTIATVSSPGGLVTGVAVGTATITATTSTTVPGSGCQTVVSLGPPIQVQQVCHSGGSQTFTATVNVSVTASNVNRAVITTTQASTVSQSTATISEAPATLQFYAYADGDASNDVTQGVTWTSSNKSVATISSGLSSGNGLATSVGAGSTNITASTTNSTGQVVSSQTIVLTVQ
ncbi:MAG TPA: Ig-like domain-containing protein [Candidatus Bathyarchaeia archaeon]|nr:Ig-like domain-containing protein [Candidatus Bathyarchaeia archaeon]